MTTRATVPQLIINSDSKYKDIYFGKLWMKKEQPGMKIQTRTC